VANRTTLDANAKRQVAVYNYEIFINIMQPKVYTFKNESMPSAEKIQPGPELLI